MPYCLAKLTRIGSISPSQWEGLTDDGHVFAAHYRDGTLSVEIDGRPSLNERVGPHLDGWMTTADLLTRAGVTLAPGAEVQRTLDEAIAEQMPGFVHTEP